MSCHVSRKPPLQAGVPIAKTVRSLLTDVLVSWRQNDAMRMLFVMLTLLAFTLWDQSGNHGQYTGPFFSILRRVFT